MESQAKERSTLWFWIGVVIIILLVILLNQSGTFKSFVNKATDWATVIMNAHPVSGAGVFFLFAAASAMLAFASSVVLVPAANLVWGKMITFLLLWSGWIAGAVAAFGIGKIARPLLVRLGYQKTLEKYQQFVSKRMKFWAVLLFCFAVPSEIPGYLFGGLHYPFWRFIGAIAISESVYALGIVIAGDKLIAAKPLPFLAIVAGLILIAVAARFLLRMFNDRKSVSMSG